MGICTKCRYFDEVQRKDVEEKTVKGYCRKKTPVAACCFLPVPDLITRQVKPQPIETTAWPTVLATDWCGEFEPTEGPLKAPDLSEPIPKTPTELSAMRKSGRIKEE